MEQTRDWRLIAGVLVFVLLAGAAIYFLSQGTSIPGMPSTDRYIKEGMYSLRGSIPGQESVAYIGSVSISKVGDTYSIWWQIGAQSQQGIGILRDSVLSVSYIDVTNPEQINDVGVVSYRVVSNNILEGTWSSLYRPGLSGTERLIWEAPAAGGVPQENENVAVDEMSLYGNEYDSLFASETFDATKDRVNSHVWITTNADSLLLKYAQDDLVNFNVETGALRVAVDSGLFERGPYTKDEDWSVVATARLDGSGVLLNYTYPDDSVEAIFIRPKSANAMSVLVRQIQEKAKRY